MKTIRPSRQRKEEEGEEEEEEEEERRNMTKNGLRTKIEEIRT